MSKTKLEQRLDEFGDIIIPTKGTSMWPMLRDSRNMVRFAKPSGRLSKYDMPIYKRSDGTLVMHRVLEVTDDSYTMCGDHQTTLEKGVTDDQIIAVAKGFFRGGRYISCESKGYLRYCKFWCRSLRFRYIMLFIADHSRGLLKRLTGVVRRS